jgi:uncharacterized protein YlxW (UPF0749 family)
MILMFAFTIVRHKMGIQVGSRRHRHDVPLVEAENVRLREQVQQLQERMKVLERIVTDRGAETAAQIEALRDKDRIESGDKVR